MLPYALAAVMALVLYCWVRTRAQEAKAAGAAPESQPRSRLTGWLLAWFDPESSQIGWRSAAAAWAFLCFIPVIRGWAYQPTLIAQESCLFTRI